MNPPSPMQRGTFWIVLLAAVAGGIRGEDVPHPATERVIPGQRPQPYVRVARQPDSRTIIMEIAVRRLAPPRDRGASIWLVGAVHIGQADYYAALQSFLDAQPRVLYEGVGRPPFMDTHDADDTVRADRTASAIAFTASRIEWYRREFSSTPRSLSLLAQAVKEHRRAEAKYLRHALADGWGRPLHYERAGKAYTLKSLGADGQAGGQGVHRDLLHHGSPEHPGEGSAEAPAESIQHSLAAALGLTFQLDGIDYDRERFINSDMSLEQIQSQVVESGGDSGDTRVLVAVLDGSGFVAALMRVGLKIIQANPRLREMVKAVMIEILGETGGDIASLQGVSDSTRRLLTVIIDQRNQVVVNDLQRLLAGDRTPQSIAVFYGAGHMLDLEKRLAEQLGYRPAEQFWLPAFSASLDAAGLTDADLLVLRNMVKAQLRQGR
jgi:hypothetical protein